MMDVSEKPRARRESLTIQMRKTALKKAIRTAQSLLGDPDPEIRLRAVHAISQSVAMLGKLENPVAIRAEKAVKGSIAPIQLSPDQVWELLEKLT